MCSDWEVFKLKGVQIKRYHCIGMYTYCTYSVDTWVKSSGNKIKRSHRSRLYSDPHITYKEQDVTNPNQSSLAECLVKSTKNLLKM